MPSIELPRHFPLVSVHEQVWNGRYHRWAYRARCRCGWDEMCDTEMLAEVETSEHIRIRSIAADLLAH